jgi:hypothetical protein
MEKVASFIRLDTIRRLEFIMSFGPPAHRPLCTSSGHYRIMASSNQVLTSLIPMSEIRRLDIAACLGCRPFSETDSCQCKQISVIQFNVPINLPNMTTHNKDKEILFYDVFIR